MTTTDKRPYPLPGLLDASHNSPQIDFAASPDCVSGSAQSPPTAGNALALTQLASSRSTAYVPQATQKVQKCSAQYRAGNNPADKPQQLSKKQFMIKNFFANKSAKSALLAIPNQKLSTSRSLATSYVYSVSQRSGPRSDGVKPRIAEPAEKSQTDRESLYGNGEGGQQPGQQLLAQPDGRQRPSENSGDQKPGSYEANNQGANQSENVVLGSLGSTAETKGNHSVVSTNSSAVKCPHTEPKPGSANPVVAPAPPLTAVNFAKKPEVDRCSISNVTANPKIIPNNLAPAAAASSAVSKQPSPGGSSGRLNLSTVASRCLKSHKVNPCFADRYTIGDELGSGGFGFVVSAIKRPENIEVAVKFICKDKVPMHAWIKDPALGLIPTEIYVLRMVDHPGIIRFVDFFEDPRYFYLVMELHGTPWNSEQKLPPPLRAGKVKQEKSHNGMVTLPLQDAQQPVIAANAIGRAELGDVSASQKAAGTGNSKSQPTANPPRPVRKGMVRRSSCDLFECIEQHTRFSEENARYIFAQLVDSVYYLKSMGICHRDVKDENIVIDKDLRVKLVDFGSAVVTKYKRVFHLFYGTISYASPEILRGESYNADAAEIWSLGILLYTMLYGEVPFSDPKQAISDQYAEPKIRISASGVDLLDWMLQKDASERADIAEVCRHPWLATVPRPYSIRQGISAVDNHGDDGRQAPCGEPNLCSADGGAWFHSLPPRPPIPAKIPLTRLGEDRNRSVQEKKADEDGSAHHLPSSTGDTAALR